MLGYDGERAHARSVRRLRAGAAPADIAVQQGEPIAIAVSRDDVVWANHASGEIMRAARSSGKPTTLVDGAVAPSGVAFDATAKNVYYLTQGAANSAGALFVVALP